MNIAAAKRLALVCTMLAPPASAQDFLPMANLSLNFGGGAGVEQVHLRLATAYAAGNRSARALMPLAAVEFGTKTGAYSSLLGVPLGAPPLKSRAAGEEDSSGGGSTWLWIGAGLVGAGAIAALAGDSGGEDGRDDNGNRTNCGVSGDVVGRNPTVINTDCDFLGPAAGTGSGEIPGVPSTAVFRDSSENAALK